MYGVTVQLCGEGLDGAGLEEEGREGSGLDYCCVVYPGFWWVVSG